MPIPDYQGLMLPVLIASKDGEVRIGTIIDRLADQFQLTPEEREQRLPSGGERLFRNRVHWAKFHLSKAGLIQSTRHGHFKMADRGKTVLASNPPKIDNAFLNQFPEFREFRNKNAATANGSMPVAAPAAPGSVAETNTPDEIMRGAHKQVEDVLSQELLDRIRSAPPEFFEQLIVTLLIAMGYGVGSGGAGRVLGRTGDNGVDGVIDQDALGLDRVYIQAKRYAAGQTIGSSAIREFFGSLDRHKAAKGLFVTTSTFSSSAGETVDMLSKRIVLIDGEQLTKLMIQHNVGCRVEYTLHIKKIDEDFFE